MLTIKHYTTGSVKKNLRCALIQRRHWNNLSSHHMRAIVGEIEHSPRHPPRTHIGPSILMFHNESERRGERGVLHILIERPSTTFGVIHIRREKVTGATSGAQERIPMQVPHDHHRLEKSMLIFGEQAVEEGFVREAHHFDSLTVTLGAPASSFFVSR